ncbi:MAG: hypothetical protein JNJ61_18105, partial [Anaerolineae bacterium]|nr:hypothetical protein [Anaerolineae bacterium]
HDPGIGVELLLALYALGGVVIALKTSPTIAPYLAVYCFAFTTIVLWGLHDRWVLARAAANVTAAP